MRTSTEQLALIRGWDDTTRTLSDWRRRPVATLWPWVTASLGIAFLLLICTWIVATATLPDPMNFARVGTGNLGDFGYILYRNGLVLALHAMACVAGFMAGSSLPVVAEGHTGWWRRVHDHAGRFALAFVAAATLFSLTTQAYALGITASDLADARAISPALLMLGISLHALPELCALFLPLAAWTLASRRGAWHELLAATFVTSVVAAPVIVAAAAVEVWVTPHLLSFLK